MSKDIIQEIISSYHNSFLNKEYGPENEDNDILMDLFHISPSKKREHRQYWGRELGMLWQRIVVETAKSSCGSEFSPPLHFGADEPCDLIIGKDAIDTKYRIGSGDSGTLKKFKQYGGLLQENGYRPVLLLLREDNLPAAITACKAGGWTIFQGQDAILYISEKTGENMEELLSNFGDKYWIDG